jgi:hypothetical protein
MRHIWATTPPGVKGRQNAAFAPPPARHFMIL